MPQINGPEGQPYQTPEIHVHVGEGGYNPGYYPPAAPSPWGKVTAVAAGLLLIFGAYKLAEMQPEGSLAHDTHAQIEDVIDDTLGVVTDPPVEENPACKPLDPPQIDGLLINAADMPRICGQLIPPGNLGATDRSEGVVGIEIFVDNPITNEALDESFTANPEVTGQYFDTLVSLNSPEGMIEQLNLSGHCEAAIEDILLGIADTSRGSDALQIGEDRSATVRLYQKDQNGQLIRIEGECS